jgi:putative aminopeptidase FrvX
MDEIGLMVKTINKRLPYSSPNGRQCDRILLAPKVIVYTKKGPLRNIGSKPPHIQRRKNVRRSSHDRLFIDIGAEVAKGKFDGCGCW